ncbi:MAG: UDP-galactopyranose mutase [Candidatus Kapaibacteriales bacterium]
MKFDYLIVGAGYSGAVIAERIASQLNKKVLIVEKRNHIAGNAYDYYDENGILVHKYGPHIFHTKMKKVWDYLSRFTDWRYYEHRVLGLIEGKEVPIPFNFNSLYSLFPTKQAERLETELLERYGFGTKVPILKLRQSGSERLNELAEYIYKYIFLNYNLKQWGLRPEELDPSVSGRVPVYLSRDNRYFQDNWQAIPKHGYTAMFENILAHPNIKVLLKTDYKDIIEDIKFDKLIFTGPIDEYFGYSEGKLPYRSLRFELKNVSMPDPYSLLQKTAQLNSPNSNDYTRTTEFRHLTGQKALFSTIAYEYSQPYIIGENDPYYPIPKDENQQLFDKYKSMAESLDSVIFAGRLANYKYYNMDETTGVALQTFEKKIALK